MKFKIGKNAQSISCIVAASLLWSVGYLIRKHIANDLGPFTITFTEALAGALLAMLFYRITPRNVVKAAKKGGWKMAVLALFGITFATPLLVLGFRYTDLGVASILEKTQPIFVVMLAALFLKEKLSPLSICLGLLGIIGAVEVIPMAGVTAGGMPLFTLQALMGAGFVVCAAFLWACAGVLGKKLAVDDLGPAHMSFLRAAIGTITLLPLLLIFETPHASDIARLWPDYLWACLNGFLDSVLCYVLYYKGLKHVAAGTASIIEVLTPVGAVLLGVVVLHEDLTLRQTLGALVVLVSVTLLVGNEIRRYKKAQQQKDVLRELKP